jgi:hypothetical protein
VERGGDGKASGGVTAIGTITARVRVTETGLAFKPAEVKVATDEHPAIVYVNHDGSPLMLRATLDDSRAAGRLLYADADVAMSIEVGKRGRMVGTLVAIAPAAVSP